MKIDSFLHFLNSSPTPYHAAHEIATFLKGKGFHELNEKEKWELKPGSSYFIVRNDSMVVAFKTPKEKPTHAALLLSHIDSPCLKLKPIPETGETIGQLGIEVYGSPTLHTWVDRDLTLAGQISVINESGKTESKLIWLENDPIIVPGLAIHLDKGLNEKGFQVNKEDHLKPIFTLHKKEHLFENSLKKVTPFKTLLSFDLFLASNEKAALLGFDQEIIASARLDNLTCAYATLVALTNTPSSKHQIELAFFFDHEEIGSMSYSGADSHFANELLQRISLHCKLDLEEYFCMKANSFAISADLTHGFHPAFSDKYDKKNAPLLGEGPVLKFNANQKYGTNGKNSLKVIHAAAQTKIPLQRFASRADIPSGSTVGSIVAARLGVPTTDVGIASWAMHSIRETIAAKDLFSLISLFEEVLKSG